jgi:hypothetical protein
MEVPKIELCLLKCSVVHSHLWTIIFYKILVKIIFQMSTMMDETWISTENCQNVTIFCVDHNLPTPLRRILFLFVSMILTSFVNSKCQLRECVEYACKICKKFSMCFTKGIVDKVYIARFIWCVIYNAHLRKHMHNRLRFAWWHHTWCLEPHWRHLFQNSSTC